MPPKTSKTVKPKAKKPIMLPKSSKTPLAAASPNQRLRARDAEASNEPPLKKLKLSTNPLKNHLLYIYLIRD
jgi:hypothetical protein